MKTFERWRDHSAYIMDNKLYIFLLLFQVLSKLPSINRLDLATPGENPQSCVPLWEAIIGSCRITLESGIITLWPLPLPKPRLISPSSNVHWQISVELTARVVLVANLALADASLRENQDKTDHMKIRVERHNDLLYFQSNWSLTREWQNCIVSVIDSL